jgi:RHS repeat-associated protein
MLVRNSYDPYGIPATGNADRFGFTGQTWLRELGLNYYKARVYSPRLGRFLQADPILYIEDFNLYTYVRNDPLNRIDSSGHESATYHWREDRTTSSDVDISAFKAIVEAAPITGTLLEVAKEANEGDRTGVALAAVSSFGGTPLKVARKALGSVGSYVLKFVSGKTYVGKGPEIRMERSAQKLSKENNDPVASKSHEAAPNEREAFKAEHQKLDAIGGPQSQGNTSTYNKIHSPGKVYCAQDKPCP